MNDKGINRTITYDAKKPEWCLKKTQHNGMLCIC